VNLTRRSALVAAVVTAVLPLAACGGGDDDGGSEEWAASVCTDMNTWGSDVQDAVSSLTGEGLQIDRDDVQAAVTQAKDATDELVDGLQELGPPDTDAGQQAKSELDELGTQLQQQMNQVEQAVEGESGALGLAQTAGTAIATAASDVQSTLESIQSLEGGELRDAFENADSCDELRETFENVGS
jgi:hypothetical protein